MITFFIICLIVGACVGFFAGLFGIGGGIIVVPLMVYLLPIVNVPDPLLMSTALGTSFATIVITGFSSAQTHYKLGNIEWKVLKVFTPILMLTTYVAGYFISNLDKSLSSKLFAVLVIYLAIKMIMSIKKETALKPFSTLSSIIGGVLIGIAASIAGIGGGGFIVPFLNSRGIEMKKAIGSSALCGMLLSFSGMISYIQSGWFVENMPNYTLGYIYLPAVLGITLTSFFTSKLGAKATTKLPVASLKRYFALLLIIIAINMLLK
ncbi:hypothetical protein EV697_10392 [Bisgaardia hudsonensis]|uniref:Probable membrane transporter protein n=1 Tax=Bisgaardia hudsonensis TaxID=109472 RepID=A0A4V2SJ27_9PAST|nr:sulfite exporter TauE/SafE family protein [Bisgaardia hudsonensis]QLB13384.1 hypothetical protein A6A11_07075 [Bisgaardia hudsonensis]TCP12788.1 hypothetical protein EV697_10392 [Bisgaardia hudsonensis]